MKTKQLGEIEVMHEKEKLDVEIYQATKSIKQFQQVLRNSQKKEDKLEDNLVNLEKVVISLENLRKHFYLMFLKLEIEQIIKRKR